MTLSNRLIPYIIPEYSLTGDLLSYQVCPLQYRYNNRGALPPSKPVQLWFGEFIHGIMEESYNQWRENTDTHEFPWDWQTKIRPLETTINRRLNARGLSTPRNLLCPYDEHENRVMGCRDNHHPHKIIGSRRADIAINMWGKHLFPLVDNAEVKFKGCRELHSPVAERRSDYYGITGIADVISSISLRDADADNKIMQYLSSNPTVRNMMDEYEDDEFEIIIDYKGMRRPPIIDSPNHPNQTWISHEWQILTYAWLRSHQPESKKPIAGILFYFDELVPALKEIQFLKKEIRETRTDIIPSDPSDIDLLGRTNPRYIRDHLSNDLRERRSIRIIPITDDRIETALTEFDTIVAEIEKSVVNEIHTGQIKQCWTANDANPENTCTVCDSRYFCPRQHNHFRMTVP
jgi:hypothetical protein